MPVPVEQSEIDPETGQDPSVMEVPAIKSAQYVGVTAPPELRALQQTQPSLRRINWEKNKRRGNRQLTNNQKQRR